MERAWRETSRGGFRLRLVAVGALRAGSASASDGAGGGAAGGGATSGGGGLLAGVGTAKVAAVVVAGLVVAGAGIGAWWFTQQQPDQVDLSTVPEDVDSVTYIDADRLAEDRAVEQVVDEALALRPVEDGPDDYEALKDEFGDETGLEFEKLHSVVAFAKYPDPDAENPEEYSAVLVRSEWSEDDFVEAQADQVPYDYEEDEYEGVTVYKPDATASANLTASWVGVLDDGRYVVGTPDAVEDAIDVANGDEDAVEGDLVEAFRETRGGTVKFASMVPQSEIPDTELPIGGGLDTGPYKDVEIVTGAYYTKEETMGVEVTMRADDEDSADDVADLTQGLITAFEQTLDDERLRSALDDIEVEHEGDTATVRFEDSVENIEEILRALDENDSEGTETASADLGPEPAGGGALGGPAGHGIDSTLSAGPGFAMTPAEGLATGATTRPTARLATEP